MNKIPIRNVYWMLCYAYDVLKTKDYSKLESEAFDENIYNLLSRILLCGAGSLVKKGLYKSYIDETDELSTVKGKINIGETIRRLSFNRAKVVCTYDDFSNNIYMNQIIKATFHLLLKKKCDSHKDIRNMLRWFAEVDDISVKTIDWSVLTFNRNNKHYDMLLYFCKLICDEYISNQNVGKKNFVKIEDKLLPALYEKFVFNFYKQHTSYAVSHPQMKWDIDYGKEMINANLLPTMQTDIVLDMNNKQLIIDTKFYGETLAYSYDVEKIRSGHLYQIYAYINNSKFDGKIAGMLLYPTINGKDVEMSCYICDKKVMLNTLNLAEEWDEIKGKLLAIVEKVFAE